MLRYVFCSVLAAGVFCAAVATAQMPGPETEDQLLATLQRPDATVFEKGLACKRLAILGTEKAVPVLAKLLTDDVTMSHYARYGLEPIPSPKVDEVLAAALGKTKGRILIGIINSIANRGKPAAIPSLAAKLDDSDRAVAKAAAHAIARLGTPAAVAVFKKRMTGEFAPACLVCANTLVKQGHPDEAVAILVPLSKLRDAAPYVRTAAMLHAVELQGDKGLPMLTSALKSDDPKVAAMALRAARLPKVKGAARAALDALADAPPQRKALLITLLGDLRDPAGLPAVIAAAKSDNDTVRVAALAALASLAGPEHVKLLVDAAMAPSEAVSNQAIKTLTSLKGDAVDKAVLALLDDPQRQLVAIRLVGNRRIAAAVPKLLRLLDGPHKVAVLTALGETVSLNQLDAIAKQLNADSDEVRSAAQKATHAACYRMPDRAAAAKKLASYLDGAPADTVKFIMNELRIVGGPTALEIVANAAKSDNPVLKDAATENLGKWLDTSAAPVLLELAKTEGSGKYGIRSLRGYIRLIQQFAMPADQRIAMARTALQLAKRTPEKRRVLTALQPHPSLAALKIVVEASEDPALQDTATRVALAMAQKLRPRTPEIRKLLAQMGQKPVKLEIIKAEYGAGSTWKDVTAILKRRARNLPLIVLPSPSYNASFGGDPVPGTPKLLKIKYRINGKIGQVTLRENEMILLPKVAKPK